MIYGSLANTSIGRLLLAGAIPGVLMGLMLMTYIGIVATRRGLSSRDARASRRDAGTRATLQAIPPMGMPVIILGGIIVGIMTPTEAAAAGAMYAFVLGFFIYRELRFQDIPKILTESVMGDGRRRHHHLGGAADELDSHLRAGAHEGARHLPGCSPVEV